MNLSPEEIRVLKILVRNEIEKCEFNTTMAWKVKQPRKNLKGRLETLTSIEIQLLEATNLTNNVLTTL